MGVAWYGAAVPRMSVFPLGLKIYKETRRAPP